MQSKFVYREVDPNAPLKQPEWLSIWLKHIDGEDEGVDVRIVYEGQDYFAVLSHYPNGWVNMYSCSVMSPNIKWFLDLICVKNTKNGVGTRLLNQIQSDVPHPIALQTMRGSGVFFWKYGAYTLHSNNCPSNDSNMLLGLESVDDLFKILVDPKDKIERIIRNNKSVSRDSCKKCGEFFYHDECDCGWFPDRNAET